MTLREFHRNLNSEAHILQRLAYELTKDMEPARRLYLETIFQAEKNSMTFKREKNFRIWITSMMKTVFQKSKFAA
jgi:DNA-directed RNA polymerase specialized sigma24 family protein